MALNSRTELLFPPRLIPGLARLRGEEWRKLVERIASLSETHPDTLAFCLMMIRLNACLGCVSGSYRFMRGCELCSHQTIARFQGTDEELIELYERAKQDLERAGKEDVDLVADTPDPEAVEEE
ncbi:MAG TPA: hypothetical protein VLC95_07155 [Anaerolineae bacterium]|nr:hypothetical protein [Anaerolineae bacterium]